MMKLKFWQPGLTAEEVAAEEEAWRPYATALRALPIPPRSRDFFLSEERAAALRPSSPLTARGPRRWAALPAALMVVATLLIGGQYLMRTDGHPTANFSNSSIQITDQKGAGGVLPAAMSAAPANLEPPTPSKACPTTVALPSASFALPSPTSSPTNDFSAANTTSAANGCP